MAQDTVEAASENKTRWTDLRQQHVRRDLIVNAVLSAFVGLIAFAMVPPSGTDWSVTMQLAVATAIALLLFTVVSALLVLPEMLWRAWE
jgi:protein-S-isoprenylcysteine O-methyltransferase Ste14